MKKAVIQVPDALEFAATLGKVANRKYHTYVFALGQYGRLDYPMAEKVSGHVNLFALRIKSEGKERFFYCYDDGDRIYVLCGYEKRTDRIPERELARAIEIKNRIGGVK